MEKILERIGVNAISPGFLRRYMEAEGKKVVLILHPDRDICNAITGEYREEKRIKHFETIDKARTYAFLNRSIRKTSTTSPKTVNDIVCVSVETADEVIEACVLGLRHSETVIVSAFKSEGKRLWDHLDSEYESFKILTLGDGRETARFGYRCKKGEEVADCAAEAIEYKSNTNKEGKLDEKIA